MDEAISAKANCLAKGGGASPDEFEISFSCCCCRGEFDAEFERDDFEVH